MEHAAGAFLNLNLKKKLLRAFLSTYLRTRFAIRLINWIHSAIIMVISSGLHHLRTKVVFQLCL